MKLSWRSYALLTFFLFGLTNFILGFIAEKTILIKNSSLSSAMILWLGMGLIGLISMMVFRLRNNSVFKALEKKHLFIAAISGITLSLGMLSLKLGFVFDPISKGPIVAIVSTNSLIVAILSWYFLKEKLLRIQLFGFMVIIAGVIVISLSNMSRTSLIAVSFGIMTMLLFAITNYILKYLGSLGLNSIKVVSILWIFSGISGLMAIGFDLGIGSGNVLLLPLNYKLLAFTAGIFLGFGMLSLKLAVSKGPAGPVVAIAGSNAILVTVLDLFVFQQMPPVIKLAGMGITLVGIFVATFFKKEKKT